MHTSPTSHPGAPRVKRCPGRICDPESDDYSSSRNTEVAGARRSEPRLLASVRTPFEAAMGQPALSLLSECWQGGSDMGMWRVAMWERAIVSI
jgi:hypothetical protein